MYKENFTHRGESTRWTIGSTFFWPEANHLDQAGLAKVSGIGRVSGRNPKPQIYYRCCQMFGRFSASGSQARPWLRKSQKSNLFFAIMAIKHQPLLILNPFF